MLVPHVYLTLSVSMNILLRLITIFSQTTTKKRQTTDQIRIHNKTTFRSERKYGSGSSFLESYRGQILMLILSF